MITFEELDKRIQKHYPAVLRARVQGVNVFPMYLRVNKAPDRDFAERNRNLEALYAHSSHHHPFGYLIETGQVKRRQHGLQDEPVAFYFDSIERYLGYLGKQDEFAAFNADVDLLLNAFPQLQAWLAGHTSEVIQYHGKWLQLIQVLQYFVTHPRPGLFARELPLQGLGTKFVEQHKAILLPLLNLVLPPDSVDENYTGISGFEQRFGLRIDSPRLRFRWLDDELARRYTGGLRDISLTVSELTQQDWQVKKVFIVENKTSLLQADVFLTLPHMEHAMAIFGSGRAAAMLASIQWLYQSQIFYWGDLDAEGFEILDHLLMVFSNARTFCMNMDTLKKYQNEWVPGSGAEMKDLKNLREDEREVYQYLVLNNLRLEQEKVHPSWVQDFLKNPDV